MNARTTLPRLGDRARLGALEVSPVCVGIVGDPRIVSAAFDAGINFFFVTADMHWPLYEDTRRGLADLLARGGGVRDRVVVAGVSYVAQPEFCHVPFRELIEAVPGLDRLDVTLMGAVGRHDFPVRAEQYARHPKDVGARALGATFHDRTFAAEAIAAHRVAVGFVRYNPEHPGAEEDLFPHLGARAPTLVYNFKSTSARLTEDECRTLGLSPDHWRPTHGDYYRFALMRPEIDGLLCAFRDPSEITAMARTLESGPLTEEEDAYLRDLATLAKGEARLAT
jgi:hypothetical protein